MNTMQSEVFDAFRSIGVDETKAAKAVAALNERDRDVASLKSDIGLMKCMMGFVLALQVAIFVKLFLH